MVLFQFLLIHISDITGDQNFTQIVNAFFFEWLLLIFTNQEMNIENNGVSDITRV
jgi:hypothetical protein